MRTRAVFTFSLATIFFFGACTNYEKRSEEFVKSLPEKAIVLYQGIKAPSINVAKSDVIPLVYWDDNTIYCYDLKNEVQKKLETDVVRTLSWYDNGFFYLKCEYAEDYDERCQVYYLDFANFTSSLIMDSADYDNSVCLIYNHIAVICSVDRWGPYVQGVREPVKYKQFLKYDYRTKELSPLQFVDQKGNTFDIKKFSHLQVLDAENYLSFVGWKNNQAEAEPTTLFVYYPARRDDIIKQKIVGRLYCTAEGYLVCGNDRKEYLLYSDEGIEIRRIKSVNNFIQSNKIPKQNIVAIVNKGDPEEQVFYYWDKEGILTNTYILCSYSAALGYDGSGIGVVKEWTSFYDAGESIPFVTQTARLSKNGKSIIINAVNYSTGNEYLLEIELSPTIELWYGGTTDEEQSLRVVAEGRSCVTTDNFYQVTGRNGVTTYYDLNGKSISKNQAGLAAMGLSLSDVLDLL